MLKFRKQICHQRERASKPAPSEDQETVSADESKPEAKFEQRC